MNHAKAIMKSALEAAGNPALVSSKVIHIVERDPQGEYGVELTPETLARLDALVPGIVWKDLGHLHHLLTTPEGLTVTLKDDNAKHGGACLRVTRDGFAVQVGAEWHRVPSTLTTLILPLGIGRLCFRFVYGFERAGSDKRTVRLF